MKNNRKKAILFMLLTLMLVFAITACGRNGEEEPESEPEAEATPAPEPTPEPEPEPPAVPDYFLWNNFAGRDPHNRPEHSANGMNIWWDNWANLRASAEGDHVQIQFRPGDFDPEDFDDLDDYFARAADWMGNWGEAIDMWAIDDISFCRYLSIRMRGAEGGEERKLMLHFQPEDGPSFVARFSDLVARGGGSPHITTDVQDIVIDLEASGFPGMTNRMHIRAFYECTIFLYSIYFLEPVTQIDATSSETILGGITVEATGAPADLPISNFVNAIRGIFQWNNFLGRDPHNRPERSTNGMNIWWDNWANMRATTEDYGVRIEFRPGAFDSEDFDDYEDYFARAADWMGNWGEAIDMWALDDIAWTQYLVIRMAGGEGGEENRLMLHFQPEDGPSFVARFSDLVARGGGSPEITTEMQDIVIDLAASGFPGMTNRMHIRAFAEAVVYLESIYFEGAVALIDTTDQGTILGAITVPAIGNPADLPIEEFINELP